MSPLSRKNGRPAKLIRFVLRPISPILYDLMDAPHEQNAKASLYMIKFQRSTSTPYTIVTPLTPLGDLEAFLAHNIFAIGTPLRPAQQSTTDRDLLPL